MCSYLYIDWCLGALFFFSSRRRHTRCALVTGVQTCALPICGEGEGRISREGATLIPLHMRARRMIGQGAILDGIFNNLALDGVLQLQGQTLTSNKMTLRAAKLRSQLVILADLATGRFKIGRAHV